MKSYLNQKDKPRGIRNNNPGNLVKTAIKWQGKISQNENPDTRFEQFINIPFGIRAMALDITNDIKKGKNTLRTLINEYAPPSENDTTAYINSVSKQTGIAADAKINATPEILAALIAAKIRIENGTQSSLYIDANDIKAGIDLMKSKTTKVIETAKKFSPIILILFASIFLIIKK
jgi:hypothetical protein